MIDINKIPLSQFIAYCKLVDELQAELQNRFPEKTDISPTEILEHYPEYVSKVINFWTGWDNIETRDPDLVMGIFVTLGKLAPPAEPKVIKCFEHEGERYYAPADLRLPHKSAPMGQVGFGQALEALQAQQLMQGNYEMVPYVLAALFLKKGETVDDYDLTDRAEVMGRLPVGQAMSAYFFLICSSSTWLKRITRYLRATTTPGSSKLALAS